MFIILIGLIDKKEFKLIRSLVMEQCALEIIKLGLQGARRKGAKKGAAGFKK